MNKTIDRIGRVHAARSESRSDCIRAFALATWRVATTPHLRRTVFAAVLSAAFAGTLCADNELCEDTRGDAGSLPTTARRAIGAGQLLAINGDLGMAIADAGLPVDTEDLYLVQVLDPAAFLAQTVQPMLAPLFDTSLWLFDPCGLGNLGNLQKSDMLGAPFARLLPTATDGTMFVLDKPGPYFLGISGVVREPGSQTGPIFEFALPGEISGPDGPGFKQPLIEWLGNSGEGNYRVILEGIAFLGRQSACSADFDGDHVVGGSDLGSLLGAWGACDTIDCVADLDRNGVVEAADLGLLLAQWGACAVVGTPCGDPDAGSCFLPDGTPGCENPCCCTLVCGLKPSCCEVAWDQACVVAASAVCPDGAPPE
jgi:hypothetical protein